MNNRFQKTMVLLCSILLCLTAAGTALAYPDGPITYLIPFKPGGASDHHAQRQMPLLKEKLGVEITVEHMAGRGGAKAWAHLVKQPADGALISGLNLPHVVLQPLAMGAVGYETEQIQPIILFQNTPIGVAVRTDSPYQTLEDLVAYAKENPNRLTFGGSGVWSGYHITFLMLQKMAGFQAIYVPSKGDSVATKGLLDGRVGALLTNTETFLAHEDELRVLALTGKETFPKMADVPTFSSLGYDIAVTIDRGVAVRAGTPEDVVQKLERTFLEIANDPAIRSEMEASGSMPLAMPAADAERYIQEKKAQWTPIVQEFKK
jgi:tripartite-type tricarboxylate transporter receptor subunit TctC